MGVYQYTLRAETRQIAGKTVGRYSYAYKHSWNHMPGMKSVARLESMADNAAYYNRGVRYFIQCDSFAEAAQHRAPVFEIRDEPQGSICENLRNAVIIGYLVKMGNRFTIVDQLVSE